MGRFMNIFSTLKTYAGNWEVTDVRAFTPEEQAMVSSAVVVNSDYGLSVRFNMIGGSLTYIPLSRDSQLTVGETVDLSKAKVLTLEREGDSPITRVEI